MAVWSSSDVRLAELRRRWEEAPNSHLFLQLAEEYRRRGDTEKALSVLRRGMPSNPTVAAEVALGRCLLESGDPEAAKTHLEAAVRRDPTQMVAYRHLVETHLQLGEGDEAHRCLEIYRQLNAHDVDLLVLSERVERLLAAGEATPDSAQEDEPRQAPRSVDHPATSNEGASGTHFETTVADTATVGLDAAESKRDEQLSGGSRAAEQPGSPDQLSSAAGTAASHPAEGDGGERPSTFSGLWQNEADGQAASAGRPGTDDEMFGSMNAEPAIQRFQESPFELAPAEPRGFDLKALPLRPLRQASTEPVFRLPRPAQAASTSLPEILSAASDSSASPVEPSQVPRPDSDGNTEVQVASVGVTSEAEEPAPGEISSTITLGRLYQEQGHAEEAARIYSEVESDDGLVATEQVAAGQPEGTNGQSKAALPIASFVPLPKLRSQRSAEDRRLLVAEAYLQRISEAKRHVS